ncbi:hypothetical protein HDU76_005809 [Blyttiomyces sp. JEL0837]|nr:hypothetical protein HDU76_005809 [Blyttiomyces sp. JEL0837]
MVGAAGAVSGVTRITVSLVIIMVELTGALTYVIPIMISITVAKWTSDFLSPDSIYDALIKKNGHPYLDHKHEHHPQNGHLRAPATAGDVAEAPGRPRNGSPADCDCFFQVEVRYSGQEILRKLEYLHNSSRADDAGFPILCDKVLVGYIAYNELKHAWGLAEQIGNAGLKCYFRKTDKQVADARESQRLETNMSSSPPNPYENDFTPWMDQAPLSVTAGTSMELVTELFVKLGVKTLCVIEKDGTFVGLIHKKRLLSWFAESEKL